MMKLELDTLMAETVRMQELVDTVSTHTTFTDDLLERLRRQLENGGYPDTAGHQEATAAAGYENMLEGLRKMQQDASQTRGFLCSLESSWKMLEEACSRSRVMNQNRLQLLSKIEEDVSNSISSCLESITVEQEQGCKNQYDPEKNELSHTFDEDQTHEVENPLQSLSTVSEVVNADQNHTEEQTRYQDLQDDVEIPAKLSSPAVLERDQNDIQQGRDEDPSEDVENPPESASVIPDFASNNQNQEGRNQVPQDDVEKPYESSTLVKGVGSNPNDMQGEGKKEDAPQELENSMQKVDDVEIPAKSSSAVLEHDQNDMQQERDEDPSEDVDNPPESASMIPDFASNNQQQEGRNQVPPDDIEKPDESSTLVKGVGPNPNYMQGEGKKEDAPQDLENSLQKVDAEQMQQNILETWREVAAIYNRREDRYLLGEYFGHAMVKKRTRKAKG